MLTQEKLKELFSYDPKTGNFIRLSKYSSNIVVGSIAGHKDKKGYVRMMVLGTLYRAHRLAWLYMYGVHPKDQLDHINNIKSDNRICNLREASGFQNNWNIKLKKNNTSGHKGVIYRKDSNKWRARCLLNRVAYNLGSFVNYDDAVAAYQEFAKKHHGDFCNLG
jgi:hypothetical protein